MDNFTTLSRLFEMRLMCLAGYTPQLTYCSICKSSVKTDSVGFSFEHGGIVCEPCSFKTRPEMRFQIGLLKYLKKLKTIDIRHSSRLKFPKGIESEIEHLTHKLLLSHIGRELKSYPFIKNMAKINLEIDK